MKNKIAEILRDSIRRENERRVGIEIERLGMWPDGMALHYEDQKSKNNERRPGAKELLKALSISQKWPVTMGTSAAPLVLESPLGKVSLEPGSQVELSTEPLCNLFSVLEAANSFETEVDRITKPWGLLWVGLGLNPLHSPEQIDLIPSVRYAIMNKYLGERGELATSMMRLTTSVQINLDYTSEEEGIAMLRAALLAAPISYALFSNSPISRGKVTPYLSYRNAIWQKTDPHRTGLLSEVFTPGFGFEAYADVVWKRPLMFAQNNSGEYVAANGKSLADFANGALADVTASEDNQKNAMRELFTEARLKPGYVEIRSVDGQTPEDRYGATAFWMGLLYSERGREEIFHALGHFTPSDLDGFMNLAIKEGLKANFKKTSAHLVAKHLCEAAKKGLEDRGLGEEKFLAPVFKIVESGENPAQRILKRFRGVWKEDLTKLIQESAAEGKI